MTQTYDIVFSGETMPEIPLETVKNNLARLFKAERAAIDQLFLRGEVTLKRDLAEAEAERYISALRQAGVLAFKTPQEAPALAMSMDAEPAPASKPPLSFHGAPEATPGRESMCCPKCGESQPKADTCTACGVVIEKFLALKARQPEPEALAESPYAPPSAVLDEDMPEFGELNFFSASGRIGRLRYLAWSIVWTLGFGVALLPIFGLMQISEVLGWSLLVIAGIAAMVIAVMIGIQRLHDIGWSGWLMLLNLVPLVGNIFPFVLMVAPGTGGANRYGPPPPPNTTSVKVLAGLSIAGMILAIVAVVATGATGMLLGL